jgi:hypothetical protein
MCIRKLIVITIAGLCLTACKDKKITETERIVNKWIGKTILFPNIETTYINDEDSSLYISNFDIKKIKEYKILFYADSTGCTECKLSLHMWKSYIEELSSKVAFLFYFQVKSKKKFLFLLKIKQFNYPVYIDSNNELDKLNKLPDNPLYQCFLLDKDNKVISIGNPANNPKVWKLYKQIITGEISDKPPVTTVEPERTEIVLNDLQAGKTSEAIFVLKNTGTNPLVIQQVESSCGCTIPEWEKQPVAAGDSTEIKVKIAPEKSEFFNKPVTVYCNTEKGRISLIVKGAVK